MDSAGRVPAHAQLLEEEGEDVGSLAVECSVRGPAAGTRATSGSAAKTSPSRARGSGRWLADLAVLSQDLFSVPVADIPKTQAVLTLVGGQVVYDAGVLHTSAGR